MRFKDKKILFIAGLHRSGTTPLFDILKGHKDISGLKDTGHTFDEGQFLQSVYPIAEKYGGPGLFAFRDEMHVTENSKYITPESRNNILNDWCKYWDLSKQVFMEKSPPNILKLRFLQELFPEAYFIIIIRNPVAVSYATQKWSKTTIIDLLQHWIKAHQIYKRDKEKIKNRMEIKYEDLVNNNEATLKEIYNFLNIEVDNNQKGGFKDYNNKYFSLWKKDRANKTIGTTFIEKFKLWKINRKISLFGYSLYDL